MILLDRTPVEWQTLRATGRDSVIVRFHVAPLVTGHFVPADGWVMLFAPLSWSGDHIFNGRSTRPGDTFVITPKNGYVTTGRDRDIFGIGLRTATLKRVMAALSGEVEDEVPLSDCTLELGDAAGAAFRRGILRIQNGAVATPRGPGSFLITPPKEAELFEHAARTLNRLRRTPALIKDHVGDDFKVVAAARHAAHANPSGATLADLCAAARVGQTHLHKSFISVHGIPPARYLRQLRLTQVREWLSDIGNPPRSVKDAALSLGFTHAGRFASEYVKMFGECPSATLDRTVMRRQP